MDKHFKILFYLNRNPFRNQRDLAKNTGISIGMINSQLKEMTQLGYFKEGTYEISEQGRVFLENQLLFSGARKLALPAGQDKIQTAVILAAGANENFDLPVGLLKIKDIPLIEHIISYLTRQNINQIIVVTGYKKEAYEAYFQGRNVTLVDNPRYKWTGTMESLACAQPFIEEDFLLIESNQIFEERAIEEILETPESSGMLVVTPSDSHDEAYVELDHAQCVFRISKDVKQLNKIDAELVGISKISYALFNKMMAYFADNKNPLLNYEYVMENIGRIYEIRATMVDDLAWSVIENEKLYRKASQIIYPIIHKRAKLRMENNAKNTLYEVLGWEEKDIQDFAVSGGLTNMNFYVKYKNKEYILRIPGACTEVMISRKSEKHNDALAHSMGFSPLTVYCDENTGIKVSEYIYQAETLSGKTARMEETMKKTTTLLRKLHSCDMHMYGAFSLQKEYEKYKKIIEDNNGSYYGKSLEMETFFYGLLKRLETIGLERKACHNDLVPENFVEDGNGRLYLIDWEYSGYNDPMWDIASHLIECEFTPVEEELFLHLYFQGEPSAKNIEKIMIYKMCQDILWSLWTISKELKGDDFGSYGQDRLNRAVVMREEYEDKYEKIN